VSCSVAVDLYWIPLGAGGHCVRVNGRVYEAMAAWREHRGRADLYHSALVVGAPDGTYAIEMTPIPRSPADRGVVAEGAVGSRWLRRSRVFRYEVRRWRGGAIPDVAEAVGGPVRVASDDATAARVLDLLPSVPTPVWGRDELHTGEMWNSNSVVSWVLSCAGVDVPAIALPDRGRAPGWDAGIAVACRVALPS